MQRVYMNAFGTILFAFVIRFSFYEFICSHLFIHLIMRAAPLCLSYLMLYFPLQFAQCDSKSRTKIPKLCSV